MLWVDHLVVGVAVGRDLMLGAVVALPEVHVPELVGESRALVDAVYALLDEDDVDVRGPRTGARRELAVDHPDAQLPSVLVRGVRPRATTYNGRTLGGCHRIPGAVRES